MQVLCILAFGAVGYGVYRIFRRIFFTFEDIYDDFNARFPRKDKEEEDEN